MVKTSSKERANIQSKAESIYDKVREEGDNMLIASRTMRKYMFKNQPGYKKDYKKIRGMYPELKKDVFGE